MVGTAAHLIVPFVIVQMALHGQIKHMRPIKHIKQQNVPMLVFVIENLELVNVFRDLLALHVKEVCLDIVLLFDFYGVADIGIMSCFCFIDSCPNDCSGHGICGTINDVSYYSGLDYDSTTEGSGDGKGFRYTNWDKESIQMCECDGGFFGADCSLSK